MALILLIAALILAILASINIPSNRISLGWASIACLIGYLMLTQGVIG